LIEVNVKEWDVLKRWASKVKEQMIGFCERCGAACGSACRRVHIRQRALDSAVRHGWRPL
jgi:hypothetical protein